MTDYFMTNEPGPLTEGMFQRVQAFMARCIKLRENTAEIGGPFLPVAAVYRGNKAVAAVMAPGTEHLDAADMLLRVLGALVRGFDADMMALAVDTYVGGDVNPATGEEWAHGEMQIVHNMGNPDGSVGEALMVYVTAPGIDYFGIASARYERNPDGSVTWLGKQANRNADGYGFTGGLMAKVRQAWESPEFPIGDFPRERVDQVVAESLAEYGLMVVVGNQLWA